MARFVAVLLAVAALLAAGRTGHAAPSSTAEVFWRAVVPDAVLRRFRADTSFVSKGMAGGMAKGGVRSTSDLDYDDYAHLPPAAGKAASNNGMAGGMAKGAGRSTSELDYDDYTRLPNAAGKAAPKNGMAKGAGRSTSELDYDDYTRLPPAAGKAEPFGYDYKAQSEGTGIREDDGPFGYDYKAPSEADKARDDGVPFTNDYKEPSKPGTGGGTTESEARGGGEAMSSESKTDKETVGAPFNYSYKAPVERRLDGSVTASESRGGREKATTTTVFFHEEAVRVGERLHFRFPAAAPAPHGLLPRHAAASVPFSTAALPNILALFRVPPGSAQAAGMAETLRKCEWPPLAGESKFCATSLEELVERAMATLETRDVRAVTSTLPRAGAPMQAYTVRAVRRVDGASFVACHDEVYPYTVYRCHTTGPARAYMMEMEGASGFAITVATVCHTDTSRWNPEHLSFKLLGTKPGGAPICHIMPYGHIIWAKNVELSPA